MSELWPGGPEYNGGTAFPITTDSVLLADFARVSPGSRVFEPCCGAGLVSLLLAQRVPRLELYCLELSESAALSARANFAANGFSALVVCGDVRSRENWPEVNSCDSVVCNPPYFAPGSGKTASEASRALARSEQGCSFADVAHAAARSLKQGGRFAFVHRAERLVELFAVLTGERLEPKRLRLVQHAPGSTPSLVLCEAVRLAKPGLKVETPLVLCGPDGRESGEMRRIYHLGG